MLGKVEEAVPVPEGRPSSPASSEEPDRHLVTSFYTDANRKANSRTSEAQNVNSQHMEIWRSRLNDGQSVGTPRWIRAWILPAKSCGDGTHKHARHGTHRGNPLGLPAKSSQNKSSRCSRTFQPRLFDCKLVYRVGMQARFGTATVRIRDTGRRWRNWLAFREPPEPLVKTSLDRLPTIR